MFQVPKPIHIWILGGMEAVQTCAQKTIFRSLKNCFFCKAQFHPVRQYKGPRQKNEPLKGIANLAYKQ